MNNFMTQDFGVSSIVLACYVAAGKGDTTHRDRPSHGLALHCGGMREYVFENGKRLTVRKNDIIYLPRSSTYIVRSLTPGDCYAINFQLAQEPNAEPFVCAVKNTADFLDSFRQAERVWRTKESGYLLRCKAELYRILYNLQREGRMGYTPGNKLEIIRPAVERIHERYDREPLPISELAAMCGITPEYFRRIFAGAYGVSPVKYINRLRLSRARELIGSGLYSVSEAATMSGYSDLSHFSREFKRAVGVPPSEYQKKELS